MRDAVERARPPARVVSAVQRDAVGSRVQVGPAQVAPGQMGPAGPHPADCASAQTSRPRWVPDAGPFPDAIRTASPTCTVHTCTVHTWTARRGLACPGIPLDRGTPGSTAPPPRAQRRPLGPTPRYAFIPAGAWWTTSLRRVSLDDAKIRNGPSPATVRGVLLSAMAILVMAALVHVLRYGLLLYNRTTLLPRLVANVALLMGVVASLAVVIAVIVTTVTMTSWLTARRSVVFRHRGQDDPRPSWALWICSPVPLVNLVGRRCS